MSNNLLTVNELHLSIESHEILKGVTASFERGSFTSVIGPNGAGKSTLLKCLNRLIDGWTGEIALDGTDVRRLSRLALSRQIGYVPQFREMPPDYSVREFLRMSRYAWREAKGDGEKVIDAALARVGMSDYSERSLQTLSGGECQKVFIAAGLVQQTPLLLLDEPSAFLDPRYQHEVGELLRSLNRDGHVTIICVSHDLNQALTTSQRILALKDGRVAFDGTPSELLADGRLEALYETSFCYVRHPDSGQMAVI